MEDAAEFISSAPTRELLLMARLALKCCFHLSFSPAVLKTLGGEEVLMRYIESVGLERLEAVLGSWCLASWPARRCVFLRVLFFILK